MTVDDGISPRFYHFHVYMIPYIVNGHWRFYTGMTANPTRRWAEHRKGTGARCLKGRLLGTPVIVWTTDTRATAMKREREIKKFTHREKCGLWRIRVSNEP